MTAGEATTRAIEMLSASPVAPARETPALDVSIILSHLLGISRSSLLAHPEADIGRVEKAFFDGIGRRSTGIPVAYITGSKEFWGLQFSVTPDVLIPKPDTEILVERAVAIIEEIGRQQTGSDEPVRVLDVCTGSGCIAISLKKTRPEIDMTATDISAKALAVARENANRLNTPVTFIEGDLRDELPPANTDPLACTDPLAHIDPPASVERPTHTSAESQEANLYHLIVSNPPYVPSKVTEELLSDGRSEPALALDGGSDGLDLVRALVDNAVGVLRHGGVLLVETGEYNAREAADIFRDRGFRDVIIHRDLENQDRVVEGKKS